MKHIELGKSGLRVPCVGVGCMRISGMAEGELTEFLAAAVERGANFFDHADIYGGGRSEEVFAKSLAGTRVAREDIIIQTKCGIRKEPGKPTYFDFSREYILACVEGSLRRLRTEYIDVLLLHRPDALVEPDEVAEAFTRLAESGKVRHFGVSNQTPAQIALLQKHLKTPIAANQLQLSIAHSGLISRGFNVNMDVPEAVDRDGDVLDYCRLHDITVQPWSPFQHGFFGGVFIDNPEFRPLNLKLAEIAQKYSVDTTTIAMAWLLRHPARLQPITGTINISRLLSCLAAADLTLTRAEWYEIYLSAGNKLP